MRSLGSSVNPWQLLIGLILINIALFIAVPNADRLAQRAELLNRGNALYDVQILLLEEGGEYIGQPISEPISAHDEQQGVCWRLTGFASHAEVERVVDTLKSLEYAENRQWLESVSQEYYWLWEAQDRHVSSGPVNGNEMVEIPGKGYSFGVFLSQIEADEHRAKMILSGVSAATLRIEHYTLSLPRSGLMLRFPAAHRAEVASRLNSLGAAVANFRIHVVSDVGKCFESGME